VGLWTTAATRSFTLKTRTDLTMFPQVPLACILEGNVEFIAHLSVGIVGNTNAARLCNGFETCRHVDTVTKYVPVIFDNIAAVFGSIKIRTCSLRGECPTRQYPSIDCTQRHRPREWRSAVALNVRGSEHPPVLGLTSFSATDPDR
jgi:hypothetical protein